MKKRKADPRINHSLFSVRNYVIFFFMVSFVVSCSFLSFFNFMDIEQLDIRKSAVVTFGNVIFLSLLVSMIDGMRRRYTVERPVKRILQETKRLTEGDFSARIEPFHGYDSMDEFDVLIEDFNKMAEELSGIETLRTDFVANVSHELKTPLSIIQNYATMLQTAELSEGKRLEYAKTIVGASRRLSDLITNILKLNKLENQQIYPQARVYDLGEQLCECMLNFEEEWEEKQLEITADIEDSVRIRGDAELMSLVWNNLFSNAIKFTESGGRVAVSLKREGEKAVVSVADTGCGMSPETGRHIFEKFYQGDTSHAVRGNGLGLALVKRVIDVVGGDIRVESAVGEGTTFRVYLKEEKDYHDGKI